MGLIKQNIRWFSLVIFCVLMFMGSGEALGWLKLDSWSNIFLQLDPMTSLLLPISLREMIWLPGLILLGVAFFKGQVFCHYLCPMGASLELAQKMMPQAKKIARPKVGQWRFYILGIVLGAAIVGVNIWFWVSPIALITRLYGTVFEPSIRLLGSSLELGGVLESVPGLAYWHVKTRHFELGFILGFFGLILSLNYRQPHFWCRYLCPCGALQKLAGIGGQYCKGASINSNGKSDSKRIPHYLPSRRAFLGSAGVGLSLGVVSLVEISPVTSRVGRQLRPPAALPESEFLESCIRCGLCLKVCPSNTLQNTGLESGWIGFLSPRLLMRQGPCEPDCNLCGQVCPTGAIKAVSLEEKQQAKIGTAVINQSLCLAWAEGKACLVCQEVCPYGAISMQTLGAISAPHVFGERCYGCGYCEYHCPVQVPAITVLPLGALRLKTQNYSQIARENGLNLSLKNSHEQFEQTDPMALPPGFTD